MPPTRNTAREQEVDAGVQPQALESVVDLQQQLLDFPDFAAGIEFWRRESGAFQHAVGGAQVSWRALLQ